MRLKLNLKYADEELITVMKELNKLGLRTLSSCTGHNKSDATIVFDIASIKDIVITDTRFDKRKVIVFRWKIPFKTRKSIIQKMINDEKRNS
jgi:hypothetical protein